jgi:hypothetical protein
MLACASVMVSCHVLLAGPRPPRAEPALREVLARAAAYVADYQLRLSTIVAEETYVQDWYSVGPKGRSFARRELRADLALIKPAGAESWAELRDVFEVDGQVIRGRDGHLEQVLRTPATASMGLATVLAENARFNVGDVDRNVNTPLFALRFLEAGNQPRFRFTRGAGTQPTPEPSSPRLGDTVFRASAEVWAITYDEVRSGTLVRTARRKDQPARGRFWIEPATGRVLASELILDDRTVRATIDVSFRSEPALGMLVPMAMRERCEGKKTGSLVEGQATYSRFRRLEP